MMLWTFAGQFGLLGDDYTFQKAVSAAFHPPAARRCDVSCFVSQVFYTSFFPVFCSPPILWAARWLPPPSSILTSETTNSTTFTHCKIVTFHFEPRHELKTVFGYGLLCACIMCPMAVAGDV